MPKPIATKDTLALTEDQFQTLDVLANDTDQDGDPLTVTAIKTSRTKGSALLNPDGTITYDARGAFDALGQDQTATDKLTYVISDGSGGTAKGKVKVTIAGVNDAPVASDDARSTSENKPIAIKVRANDHDVDKGDALTVSAVDDTGTAGVVTLKANGKIRYDPNGQFEHLSTGETETDSFSYTVTDEHGETADGTVTVTLRGKNDRPTDIFLDNLTVDGDVPGAVVGTLTVIDPDSDTHTFRISQPHLGGTDSQFEVEGDTLKLKDGEELSLDLYYFHPATVRITATDPAGARITETFKLVVNDVNEAAALSTVLEQSGVDGSSDTLV